MKKIFIGSFVGAIVLFFWSFLAWTTLPIHLHTLMYTPAQDAVLKALADNNVETGSYAMPIGDNRNATSSIDYHKESEKMMEANMNKPAAVIHYRKEGYEMGPMTIIKGFLINFLAVFAACILLAPGFATLNSFFGRWWLTLVAGLLITACGPLIHHNWLGVPWNFTVKMILDTFLNWGITGLWLAYYFGRK